MVVEDRERTTNGPYTTIIHVSHFQSFLFQNMQMIGLEEDNDEDRKQTPPKQPITDGKIFKTFGSISVSTKETYLSSNSNMNRKEMAKMMLRLDEDPYDLNNQEPKFVKKKSNNSSFEAFPEPPVEFFAKKDQMFESNVMDFDMNYIMNDDEIKDSKCLSSPETNIKFSFKSSTPILTQDKNDSSQDEREVKSPKLAKKERISYRKFSPCRSIFDKKTMSKASLNSFNEDESFIKTRLNRSNRDELGNSNYIVSSRVFDKKKFNMALKSNTSSESDLNGNSSSLESVLMEPYLVKFEEELIKNSKSEIIKDLSNLNQSLLDQQPRQKNVFQKYFNEIKNLTLKKSKSKKEFTTAEQVFKVNEEELVYDEDVDIIKPEIFNKDNLRVISKSQIPWQNLDLESSNQLLNSVLDNLNTSICSDDLPILYSKKGNKISKNQVKRWYDLLDNLAQSEIAKQPDLDTTSQSVHRSKLYTSKQYLMNKKRQFMEKVQKKPSKMLDVSQTGSEISKSKLYANVVPPEKFESISPKKSKRDQDYINDNYFDKQKSPRKLNPDHFYNEITDLENRQAARHKNREKERVDRNAEPRHLSKKNSELLQQIVDYTETSMHDSTQNMIFKRNIAAIAKLKSPERKILYKEWFTILKRMEKDPKFDLETLVRTRGRFTENDKISYRTKLMEKNEKIRSARSEPNFSTMFNSNRANKTRSGMNTTPAAKAPRNAINFDPIGKSVESKQVVVKQEPVSQNALKLTLEKSDINKIKDLLKKKDKSLKTDLTNLKEKTNLIKMAKKTELDVKGMVMSNIANQKHRLNPHAIINEECEDNEDNLKIRLTTQTHKKQITNTSKQNHKKYNQNLNDSAADTDIMDDDTHNSTNNPKHESKLVSKCKKMYNNSETAKAFNEVSKMVKGLKIGNKLKNITSSSSKFIHKAMHHNEEHDVSVDSERHRKRYDLKASKSINSETGSQASFTLSSSNISEEEAPKRPQRHVNRHEDQRLDKRTSSARRDEKNGRSKDRSNNRGGSSKVGASPARPPPPKRPPPPRPFSPASSCSSISANVKKSSRHRDEEESLPTTPQQHPKSSHLPPRPKPPSNLPPRPPRSKHRNEESFDENSFEIEDRHRSKHDERSVSKSKRTTSNSSRQDHGRKNVSRNTTPVRSPTMTREIKSRSNVRKEVSRR